MRIMHISTRLILGGSQENTLLSCEGQADHGHEVSLVFGPIYGPEGSMLERANAHTGIETIQTPSLVRELAPLRDYRCYKDLKKIIAGWKPDVVHTHSSKAGIIGRAAAWKLSIPCVVHTIHGLAFHPYQTKWRNAIYIAAERYAAKRCHKIICVADAMRHQALAQQIGTSNQYITVHSGMDTQQFTNPARTREQVREELGFTDDDFVLGTIARLAELKGHDDLLDALSTTMLERPNLKLLWIGDGWWRKRLLKRVSNFALEDNVVPTGLVQPHKIGEYIQAMDALVHPSYREGLPRAVPQALLSKVPVIAYDVDGAKEVCLDGETGQLVKVGDLAALRNAAIWMMDHPKEKAQMGINGCKMCLQMFASHKMVDKLQEIYADVLSKQSSETHSNRVSD